MQAFAAPKPPSNQHKHAPTCNRQFCVFAREWADGRRLAHNERVARLTDADILDLHADKRLDELDVLATRGRQLLVASSVADFGFPAGKRFIFDLKEDAECPPTLRETWRTQHHRAA